MCFHEVEQLKKIPIRANRFMNLVYNAVVKMSVVIPCFNSPESLESQVKELRTLGNLSTDIEVILVCDDESELTWKTIRRIAENQDIKAIWLGKNMGQHRATFYGARQACHEIVATIDDDYQYPVSAMKEMLLEIQKGHDLVYGRPVNGKHGNIRNFLSKSFKRVLSKLHLLVHADMISSQRVFDKKLISNVDVNLPKSFNLDSLMLSRTSRVSAVNIEITERASGVSNYTFRKLVKHSTNMISARVDVLSTTMFGLGVLGLLISSAVSTITVLRYMAGSITVPGYSSLILLLGFGMSTILILQGIAGRMLSLLLNQIMGHQSLWIRDEVSPTRSEGN